MKTRWIFVLCVALVSMAAGAGPVGAAPQDAPAPADETEAAREAEAAEGEAQGKKTKNGLYVEVGQGSSDLDPLDMSLRTSTARAAQSSLGLSDMEYARAAIGWQLPVKGRFRIVWQGFNEDGYEFSSVGRDALLSAQVVGTPPVVDRLDWWTVSAIDGSVTATRTPPVWSFADDANNDGRVQRDEVRYPTTNFTNTLEIEPNLQNRIHIADALYGRDFGPRRVEGRWWGGLRYFAYEGTLMQGAWLSNSDIGRGLGFTDGAWLRFLHPRQEATGAGPTAALGFQVNLFDKRVQFFLNGQFAFLISQIEVQTGRFFTIVPVQDDATYQTTFASLRTDRSRTSWHTHYDTGLRLNLKQGLILEVAFYQDGFLDAVITPSEIRIPASPQEIGQGTSAVYATQDLVLDGWRAGLGFQF